MLKHLCQNKRFLPLLVPHFFSAICYGFVSLVFLFFTTYKMTESSPIFLIPAVILFSLSFCVGSIFVGPMVDKYPKTKVLQGIRICEITLMVLALISLSLDSRWLLVLIVALQGAVTAALRVADYALLPVLVEHKELNKCNILLKASTAVGIVFSILLLTSVLKFDAAYSVVCFVAFSLSVAGFLISLKLPQTEAADSSLIHTWSPVKVFAPLTEKIKNNFDVWTYIAGVAWFWVLAGVVGVFSAEYGRYVLNARWSVVVFLVGVFLLGYVAASFLYAKLSRKNNLGTWTALVCAIMSVFLLDLVFASGQLPMIENKAITVAKMFKTDLVYWRILLDVFVLGGLSAFYIIPFYGLFQTKTPYKILGRLLGFSNMMNAFSVAVGFLMVLSLRLIGIDVVTVLGILAVLNIFMAIYMIRLLPLNSRRALFRKVFQKVFDAKIEGLENLAVAGPRALIVTNHTSYLDVLLISAFIDKKIVFTVSDRLIDKPLVKFMTNLVDVKPLDPVSPFAVKSMAEELQQDKLCMILTEGFIDGGNTRMKLYEGPAMMALKGEAPVLPIRIEGAQHALFSRVLGEKADFRLFPKIKLTILPPVEFSVKEGMTTREIREKTSSKLYDIMSQMTFDAYEKTTPVFVAIARAMKMAGRFKAVLEDTTRKPVKFAVLFLKSFVLGRLINKVASDEKYVGLMIPTSNACALSFLGLQAFGKIPCMINFTSGPKQVLATCQTVGLKTIVTAKKVVQLAKLEHLIGAVEEAGIRVVYLEDLQKILTTSDKLFGVYGALCPEQAYKKTSGGQVQTTDPAVVLFTSGSEGMPKAVFLTHGNLISNCYQVPSRFDIYPSDVFLNCLPMFHSFGLGAGMILPLLLGVKTFLYPTPLHYRIIPEICASVKASVFFGTDTFLAGYAKCANPYDFNSLRIVVAGAEKVKEETRRIWSEKFGVRIFEGYGATECSPFIAVNTFLHQSKGSVGRILPGMIWKLREVPGIKEGKELLVKGPNIMKGYMRYDKPLELDPPADGWYDTGDIVQVDEEGYIYIKGRSKRFAKIGGEMVSLLSVEMVVEKKWPGYVYGAVNIPDAKKGEQIVLITTCKDITKEDLVVAFKAAGVTELGIPSRIITTDEPPLLGTGKFDYVKAKELAEQTVNG